MPLANAGICGHFATLGQGKYRERGSSNDAESMVHDTAGGGITVPKVLYGSPSPQHHSPTSPLYKRQWCLHFVTHGTKPSSTALVKGVRCGEPGASRLGKMMKREACMTRCKCREKLGGCLGSSQTDIRVQNTRSARRICKDLWTVIAYCRPPPLMSLLIRSTSWQSPLENAGKSRLGFPSDAWAAHKQLRLDLASPKQAEAIGVPSGCLTRSSRFSRRRTRTRCPPSSSA